MHTANIPVLNTKRLSLRGPEAQDYPDFKTTFSSYRSRFMGGPLNAYEAWMLYAAEIGHWNIRGFGMWMIHDRITDETYGMAGVWQPAGWPTAELAWIIWPKVAGRGIALEATHAVRDYAYEKLNWDTAVSYLDPKNLEAVRLAERLGCTKDADAPSVDDHDVVYRHPTPNALHNSQLRHGIEMEIDHYRDPEFTPKGWALD